MSLINKVVFDKKKYFFIHIFLTKFDIYYLLLGMFLYTGNYHIIISYTKIPYGILVK